MSVKAVNQTRYIRATLENDISLAIRLMLEGVHREANDKTPYQYGSLRGMVVKQMESPTKGSITWNAPYAIYQEKGRVPLEDYVGSGEYRPFENYTTPGTTAGFAITAVDKVVRNSRDYLTQAGVIR